MRESINLWIDLWSSLATVGAISESRLRFLAGCDSEIAPTGEAKYNKSIYVRILSNVQRQGANLHAIMCDKKFSWTFRR